MDVILLPGLAPEHHDGDAGGDAAQGQVQPPILVQVLGSAVDHTASTEVAKTTLDYLLTELIHNSVYVLTCSHVVKASTSSMIPILRHVFCFCY